MPESTAGLASLARTFGSGPAIAVAGILGLALLAVLSRSDSTATSEHHVTGTIAATRPAYLASRVGEMLVQCGARGSRNSQLVRIKGTDVSPVNLRFSSAPGGLAWPPSGARAAVGLAEEQALQIVDLDRPAPIERVRLPFVPVSVALFEDGAVAAAGAECPAVYICAAPRKLWSFEFQPNVLHVPFHQKVLVLAGNGGVGVVDRADVARLQDAGPIPMRWKLPVPAVGGVVSDSLGSKLYVTLPQEARLLIVSLPELTLMGERAVPGLIAGQPAVNGTRIGVPTEKGIALLDESTDVVDTVDCGEGEKACLFDGRRLWVARRDAPAIDVVD